MKLDPIFCAAQHQEAEKIFSRPCHFVLSAASLHQLPSADRPEIAFVGRSNVGKSSLINALFNRKDLAKTSSTPGRTQQLNFFDFDHILYLVDLPGYGFAKAPPEEVRRWQNNMSLYLQGRPTLRRVFLLVDSRHGLKKADMDMIKILNEAAVTHQIILTKCDKISNVELKKVMDETLALIKKWPAAHPQLLYSSATKKTGLDDVRVEIASLMS